MVFSWEHLLEKYKAVPDFFTGDLICVDKNAPELTVGTQAWIEADNVALVKGLISDDPTEQLNAVKAFRDLLSIERVPPIDEVIRSGALPHFVKFLKCADNWELQFESAWAVNAHASE